MIPGLFVKQIHHFLAMFPGNGNQLAPYFNTFALHSIHFIDTYGI
jgi:hypothetical protein